MHILSLKWAKNSKTTPKYSLFLLQPNQLNPKWTKL
jgi:hypothetical protein